MPLEDKIGREPGNHEIEQIIAAKLADGCAPKRLLLEDFRKTRSWYNGIRHQAALARHPFHPSREPQQADESDPDKHRPPAKPRHQKSSAESAHGVAAAQGRHHDTVSEPSMVFRHMQ